MANWMINPSAALGVADQMSGATGKLDNSLQTLNGSVQRFIAANQGEASEAYHAAQVKWNQGHAEMQAALNLGGKKLETIIREYVLGDKRGAGFFGG
jgi:WXG100 family type VII secretion target